LTISLLKKKLIIFDLDGVLIDSKKNMYFAWKSVKKKYNIKIPFNKYFRQVGKPFQVILKKIGIKKNLKLIEKEYSNSSIKNFNKIKLYKNVKKIINLLNKNKEFITAIVTSKSKSRTFKILKLFNLKVNYVQCPEKNLRGKPYPDQIIKVVKKFKIKKKNCYFIGDTVFDKKSANKSKITFILANYGYKIGIKKYKYSINNIDKIFEFIK
jgi:phosphoglycolate phosphatase